jgi:hypothetical protein
MYDGSVCRRLRYEHNAQSIVSWVQWRLVFWFLTVGFHFSQAIVLLRVWVMNEIVFSGHVLSVLSI